MTMIMITRAQRFLRSRQLHTIISQETIKPSSPTPPHLKTHNLSNIDQMVPNIPIPLILFYKNYNHGDINILKKSLSQTLTSYYPFSGRQLTPAVPQIDCNDQGVEFLEASNDRRLADFIFMKEMDGAIDELIPNGASGKNKNKNPGLVEVQLNHFTCGGAALAVSISHKVADGFTMLMFIKHWATVALGGTPKNPTFLPSKNSKLAILPELNLKGSKEMNYVTRRFIFPNSKLNELKNKINMPINPTRVDLVTSLVFKCAVHAAAELSGSLPPSKLHHAVNVRNKIIEQNRPEIGAGNLATLAVANMADSSEIKLNEVIAKLRKDMTEIKEVRDTEHIGEMFLNKLSASGTNPIRLYFSSSLCRFPYYEIDFGWGKPVQVMIKNGVFGGNLVHFLDTPSGDGIEAIVHLDKEELDIFEKDNDILAYSQDI